MTFYPQQTDNMDVRSFFMPSKAPTQKDYDTEAEKGLCNDCHKEWGCGKYCKVAHNHSTTDKNGLDKIVCCDCFCKQHDWHCPDAWRYEEKVSHYTRVENIPTCIPHEDEHYKWDYDDMGVLCRFDKETEGWEPVEDHCVDCGHLPDECDCE